MKIAVINGVNLDMLGTREKHIYGADTLRTIEESIVEYGRLKNVSVSCFQSNIEGEIVELIHSVFFENYDAIIINAGAYSHYSYAIYDALKSVYIPKIEVHISNIYARGEEFRHKSVLTSACVGMITGLGSYGYILALDYLIGTIE